MWLRPSTAKKVVLAVLTTLWAFVLAVLVDFTTNYLDESWGLLKTPENTVALVHHLLLRYIHNSWIFGSFLAALFLLTGFTLGQWTDDILRKKEKEKIPPIGSFRYVFGQMRVGFKQSTGEGSAQIEIEFANDTEKIISFHAVTSGHVNGIPFDKNKVIIEGLVYPKNNTKLVSKRLVSVDLGHRKPSTLDEFLLVGHYEYDISYGYHREKLGRRTSQGCRFEVVDYEKKEPGTRTDIPITVITYNHIEE